MTSLPIKTMSHVGALFAVSFLALPTMVRGLDVGTGGYNSILYHQARGERGYRSPFISIHSSYDIDNDRQLGDLEFVFSVLNPSVSELARALGVSRETIYNWRSGESISAANAERLHKLAQAAALFDDFDSFKIKELMRRKIGGLTLLEYVARGSSPIAIAQQLVTLATREEAKRKQIVERVLRKPTKRNWLNEYDSPHLVEEG